MKKSFQEMIAESKSQAEAPKDNGSKKSFDQVLGEKVKSPPPTAPAAAPPPRPPSSSQTVVSSAVTNNITTTLARPMSQSIDDFIFLQRDGANYSCKPGEVLYAYNRRDKSLRRTDNADLLQRLTAWWKSTELEYYRVRPRQLVSLPPLDAYVRDTAGRQHQLECNVTILALAGEREAEAISRLVESGSPLDTLRACVITWLDDFAVAERRNGNDITENFTSGQRAEAGKHIAARAVEFLGIKIECAFYFPAQDGKLPPLNLSLADVRLRETELPGPVSAQVEIHLTPDPEQYARRMRKSQSAIRQDIEGMMRNWFRSACTLEQFCFCREDVRRGLQNAIRVYVEETLYMKLDDLKVQCLVPFPKEFIIRPEYTSKGVVQPGNHELVVNHQLMVQRVDLGLFYAEFPNPPAPAPTLRAAQEAWNKAFEQWVDDLLKRVTRQAFFGKSYAQVSLKFEKLCEDLKKEVQKEFGRIGFVVQQLISIPAEKQIRDIIGKQFTFDTGAIPCKTREANVDYSISAHVGLEVASHREIEKYLLPGQALQNQFVQVATEAIRNEVRTLEPKTLYTEFAAPGPTPNSLSPEDKICTTLKTSLKQKFDAVEATISITLTPEPTEVTKLYDALCPPESHRCAVQVEARGSRGEKLTFDVDYRVVAIAPAGWSKFQEQCRKNPGADTADKAKSIIGAINKAFASKAATKLISLSAAQLTSPHHAMTRVIEEFGLEEAKKEVSSFLGLEVRIMNIQAHPGEWTDAERKRERESYQAAREDYQAALDRYRECERTLVPGHPQLEEMRRRVKECEQKLDAFGTGHDEYFKNAPTMPPPLWTSILGITSGENERDALPPPKTDPENPDSTH